MNKGCGISCFNPCLALSLSMQETIDSRFLLDDNEIRGYGLVVGHLRRVGFPALAALHPPCHMRQGPRRPLIITVARRSPTTICSRRLHRRHRPRDHLQDWRRAARHRGTFRRIDRHPTTPLGITLRWGTAPPTVPAPPRAPHWLGPGLLLGWLC
jgi:hypothetical protein